MAPEVTLNYLMANLANFSKNLPEFGEHSVKKREGSLAAKINNLANERANLMTRGIR